MKYVVFVPIYTFVNICSPCDDIEVSLDASTVITLVILNLGEDPLYTLM
jgi:hypothetical protein